MHTIQSPRIFCYKIVTAVPVWCSYSVAPYSSAIYGHLHCKCVTPVVRFSFPNVSLFVLGYCALPLLCYLPLFLLVLSVSLVPCYFVSSSSRSFLTLKSISVVHLCILSFHGLFSLTLLVYRYAIYSYIYIYWSNMNVVKVFCLFNQF